MNKETILGKVCRTLSHFLKELLNFVTMRRLLTRVINRVLLYEPFKPTMSFEAEIHTEGRRKMVVGLGNPGMDGTRHSVGMAVLGALAARLGVADRWRGDKHVSGDVIVSEDVVLLRPRTLMNVNGVSVAKAAGKFGVRPEDILLVHDELDKPLGKVAVKLGGSARGHNGVRSCVDCLQTDVMLRLRVGIGRPAEKTSVERHVLSRFTSEELQVLDRVLVQSVDLILARVSQQDLQTSSPDRKPSPEEAASRRKRQKKTECGANEAANSEI